MQSVSLNQKENLPFQDCIKMKLSAQVWFNACHDQTPQHGSWPSVWIRILNHRLVLSSTYKPQKLCNCFIRALSDGGGQRPGCIISHWLSPPSPLLAMMCHVLSAPSAPWSLPWRGYTAPGVDAGTGLQLSVSGQAAGISAPAIILLLTQCLYCTAG